MSSGFVGTPSDGLTQLDSTHALSPTYTDATSGNVEQTAQVNLNLLDTTTIALGFGTTQSAAVHTAAASSAQNYLGALAAYEAQWQRYDNGLRRAGHCTSPGSRTHRLGKQPPRTTCRPTS